MSLPTGWDWRRMVPVWDWHTLQLHNYPGWEVAEDGHPYYVELTHTVGEGKQSRELAVAFDDLADGQFYYRDFTDSGIPFVHDREVYRSRFSFQRKHDKDAFEAMVRR